MTAQSSNNRLNRPIFSQCPGSIISSELAVHDKSYIAKWHYFEEYSAEYLWQKTLLTIHPNDYVWIFKTYKSYVCYGGKDNNANKLVVTLSAFVVHYPQTITRHQL